MRLLPLAVLVLTLAACRAQETPDADASATTPVEAIAGYDAYGTALADTADAMPAEVAAAQADSLDGQAVKLVGTLRNVCQMAGCWATIETPDGTIRITVPKNADGTYVYTMPKDIVGRRVVASGTLRKSTLTADHAEHMARESGQEVTDSTKFEDAPEIQLEATGVLVAKAG
ncbi:MAG TPA: DUF4920 domain-containing protein [Rhodothermales bacterium]|nr:DUF4920 domain-containing protein [Rhodothermales bacterium]